MAKIEALKTKPGFIRSGPRPVIELRPEDVLAFITATEKESDSYWVRTTPEIAQRCLELMGPNRRLREKHCDRIARAMLAYHFHRTNMGVGFNTKPEMFDALNRMTAIVRTGMEQVLLWVIGLPMEAQSVIDCNAPRTFAEELQIAGKYQHTTLLAAAVQWLLHFKASQPDGTKSAGAQKIKIESAPRYELEAALDKHLLLGESCTIEERVRSARRRERMDRKSFLRKEVGDLLPPSLMVAIHHVGAHLQGNPDEASSFLETIVKFPDMSSRGDAAYAWAKFLYDGKVSSGQVRAGRTAKMIGTIRAWNLYREGKTLDKWLETKYEAFRKLDYSLL